MFSFREIGNDTAKRAMDLYLGRDKIFENFELGILCGTRRIKQGDACFVAGSFNGKDFHIYSL